MESRIVRYRLEAQAGPRTLSFPKGSEVLGATYHQGAVGLWVRMIDPHPPAKGPAVMETRTFEVLETGADLEGRIRYLGTCGAPGGAFTVHVVERPEEPDPIERLEDNLEEIADNLRTRVEALEGSGTHEPPESVPLDLLARVETLEQQLAGPDPCGALISGLAGRIEALEKAPRVLATVVDPETKEAGG